MLIMKRDTAQTAVSEIKCILKADENAGAQAASVDLVYELFELKLYISLIALILSHRFTLVKLTFSD